MLISASAPAAKKLVEPGQVGSCGGGPLVREGRGRGCGGRLEGESGSGPPLNPIKKAVTQMADILSVLTSDRASRAKGSKVEAALDAVSSTTSTDGVAIGSGKKAAAARRALYDKLWLMPQATISSMVEKLMLEDLLSRTLGAGMPETELCARAWAEHRSRIGSYKSAGTAAGEWQAFWAT